MERCSVSSIIPAKNVIGKSKHRVENFEDNWTDSEQSDNDSEITPGSSESPRFRNKNRGHKTGVKVFAGKYIRPLDKDIEDCTEGKPVTDSSYHTRPPRLINASNFTCPSSLKQNNINNGESSDSDQIIDRQISQNRSQKVTKSTSLKVSPRTSKFTENLQIHNSYKTGDNGSDKISFAKGKTNVVESESRHLSSKDYLKNKKLLASSSSMPKRKINVVENTENNTQYLEQEFEEHNLDHEMNTPIIKKSKYHCKNFRILSNVKANSQQISLKRELGYADREPFSNAAPEIFHANETGGAAVNTHQYFSSKKPSRYKKLYSSHSLKTKGKTSVSENTEMHHENMQTISKGRNLKHKNKAVEVPTDHLRRSKRDRISPLKYWANERRLFRNNIRTGEIKCLGIDPGTGEDDESRIFLNKMQEKRQQAKMKKKNTLKLSPSSKTTVYNKHRNKNEHVVLHMLFDNISWKSPSAGNNKEEPAYYLSNPLNSRDSIFGFIKIRPNKKKPSQISPAHNIHFSMVRGQVKLVINDTVYELKKMDSFIVPKHQSYSIENLLKSYALLSFCAFKVPFFDYEME